MKIAMVALQASPLSPSSDTDLDNQAERVSSLARALTGPDHRVTVYARKDAASLPGKAALAPGVTVEYVPAGPPEPLPADKMAAHVPAFSAYLAERWGRSAPDVAHAHFWTSGLAALAGARGLPVSVVQTFQSLGAPGRPAEAGKPRPRPRAGNPAARLRLEPVIARSVSAVLAGSSTEMSALARLGVPRASVSVVPRGVDTAVFRPEGPAAERTGRPRLLCVTPLAEDQGLDTVLRALPDVPDAELVIAGGPDHAKLRSGKVYRSLAKLARELGVGGRLVWHGQVSAAGLPALLRSADLLVDMASLEATTSVTLEAMACGIPVVAAAVGSHTDTVVDGITGFLVPPGEPGILARRLRRLLASPMLVRGYGLAAADRARSRYSWERIGQETLAIYEHLLPRTDLVSPPRLPASR
jgi:glycosyltransferase involved in cell wall biosynthesis